MKHQTFLFTLLFLISASLPAQVLKKGQAVSTMFSGGRVAQVNDVRNNGLACIGVNWDLSNCATQANITTPSNWSISRMGSIFGIAIDKRGNVFFGSSYLVPGAFVSPAAPFNGVIFKADWNNLNNVSDFIVGATPYSNTTGTNKSPSGNRGFGNLAYDNRHDQMFATNLIDGKIYRITGLTTASGTVASIYDPFNAFAGDLNNPEVPDELLWGIGINIDNDGIQRLYFSLQKSAAPSEIWSIEIDNTNGDLLPGTLSLEIVCQNNNPVTDIAFKPGDKMLIAERDGPHNSSVWEYTGTHLAWLLPKFFQLGDLAGGTNSAGGVDYGYRQPVGNTTSLGSCSEMVWASGNSLIFQAGSYVYGLAGIPASGNESVPFLSNVILVDQDFVFSSYNKGTHGDVEVFRDSCPSGDLCRNVSASAEQIDDPNAGKCCWSVSLNNQYEDNYFSAVQFSGLDGVQLSYSGVLPTWDVIQHTPSIVTISPHALSGLPKDNFPGVLELCLSGAAPSPQKVVVKWLAPGPDSTTTVVCTDTLIMDCPDTGNPRCVRAVNDSLVCLDGKYTYIFKIRNNAPFAVQSFMITPLDPNIVVSPALTNLPPPGILTNTTSGFFSVNLSGSGMIPGNPFCFYLTAHNVPISPGVFPQECCTDSVLVDCLPIPECDPCDGITLSAEQIAQPGSPNACCFSLSVTNHYYPGYFTGIQIAALGDAQLSYVSGWSITPPVLPSLVTLTPPGGTLALGTFSDIAEICLNGFTTPTQQFVVSLLGPDSSVVCADTFVSQCPPPPPPTCAIATSDSIWCDGGQVKYTFWIKNSPLNTFNIESFNLVLADPTGIQTTQQYFVLGSPLAPGNQAGPFTIDLWGSAVLPGNQFCYILTAHDGIWGGDPKDFPTTCCTDSVNVRCLPIPDCANPNQDSCCCCTGADLQLPNGFSPNADGVNDSYEIIKSNQKPCGKLSLTILNRWGNVVWETDDYQNQWNGTNQNGVSLPEGTYFVILTVQKTGQALTNFVDLRR